MSAIRWPARFDPKVAPIHARNELAMSAAPADAWAWLIRAVRWPEWYANAHRVRLPDGAQDLAAGREFRWQTFGVSLRSRVEEFEPGSRIGWSALGLGVDVYHAWLIEPRAGGCWVLTEETQYGFATRLGRLFFPGRMEKWHQIWLENLARQAAGGPPRD